MLRRRQQLLTEQFSGYCVPQALDGCDVVCGVMPSPLVQLISAAISTPPQFLHPTAIWRIVIALKKRGSFGCNRERSPLLLYTNIMTPKRLPYNKRLHDNPEEVGIRTIVTRNDRVLSRRKKKQRAQEQASESDMLIDRRAGGSMVAATNQHASFEGLFLFQIFVPVSIRHGPQKSCHIVITRDSPNSNIWGMLLHPCLEPFDCQPRFGTFLPASGPGTSGGFQGTGGGVLFARGEVPVCRIAGRIV